MMNTTPFQSMKSSSDAATQLWKWSICFNMIHLSFGFVGVVALILNLTGHEVLTKDIVRYYP